MSKKGNLFLLIKSLSAGEKRYFRQFAHAFGKPDANYLLLFDALDKQDQFDEGAIRTQFEGRKFLNQLHVLKIYLKELILKSLRNYHSKPSKSAELKDLLRNIELLFNRELYDLCAYELLKAAKLARKYEVMPAWMEILNWRRRLLIAWKGPGKTHKEINEIIQEELEVLQKWKTQTEYWHLTLNQFELQFTQTQTPLPERPLFKDENYANTLQSRVHFFHLQSTSHVLTRNSDAALAELDKLINWLDRYPHRIQENPSSYITTLSNKITYLLRTKRREQIPAVLEEIRSLPDRFKMKRQNKVTVRLLLRCYNVELEMYRDTGNTVAGVQLAEEVVRFLQQYEQNAPKDYLLLVLYQLSHIYFQAGEYSLALKQLNHLIDTPFGTQREDLQSYARLLFLITHYEMGNILFLKYAIQNVRYFLKKKRTLEAFEQALLTFFSRACTSPMKSHPALFQALHTQLFEPDPPLLNESQLDYLDFKQWIEGKIQPFTNLD